MKKNLHKTKEIFDKKQYFPETDVPEYVVHDNDNIRGFFGKYRFLSNFFPCSIWYEGLKYPSTEHAYQSAKVNDIICRIPFMTCSAKEVKKLGNTVTLNKEDWDNVKYDIMLQLVTQKFAVHKTLQRKLVETDNAFLEETNHWNDVYWGVCNGRGENKLGKILMVVRSFWK